MHGGKVGKWQNVGKREPAEQVFRVLFLRRFREVERAGDAFLTTSETAEVFHPFAAL
jgi:hypothetical protein